MGFTKNRPEVHGPRRPVARQPGGSVARGPQPATAQWPGGPAVWRPGPDFLPFFVHGLIHAHAQVCIGFGCAKWATASLNLFTIIILNNHFNPFIRCMLLREKCFHSLFIRLFTKPEREEVHSQRCKLFSNHSLR